MSNFLAMIDTEMTALPALVKLLNFLCTPNKNIAFFELQKVLCGHISSLKALVLKVQKSFLNVKNNMRHLITAPIGNND